MTAGNGNPRRRRLSGREEILGLDRRKALVTLALAIVLAVGAVALVGDAAGFGDLLDALREANKWWFAACAAGLVCSYAGYIMGYREVARMHGGPDLPVTTTVRVVALGFGANALGSGAGGLAVDFWALHRAGVSLSEAARRVLGFNTFEWGLLGAYATAAGGLALVGNGDSAPPAMALTWIVVVPLCVAAAAWISSPKRAHRFTDVRERASLPSSSDRWAWLRWLRVNGRKVFADVIGGVVVTRHLVLHPREHPAAVVGFSVYWFGHLLTLWAALRAFTGNTNLALASLVLAFATGYAASALPLPAGGSGGIETALAFSLHAVGVPLAPALLGVLVYRFFSFWLPLVPAVVLLSSLRRLNDELPRIPAREPA